MYARELEKRGRLVILEANRQFNNWIEIVQGAWTFPFPVWGDPPHDATWSEAPASWPPSLPFFSLAMCLNPVKCSSEVATYGRHGSGHLRFLPALILAILLRGRGCYSYCADEGLRRTAQRLWSQVWVNPGSAFSLCNLRLLLCVPVLTSGGSGTSPSLRDGDGWYRLWHVVSA